MFLGFGGEEHVVHIDNHDSFFDHIFENFVHHGLECGRRITHAEEHYCWFKQSSVHFEGGFPFISFLDPYVVISPSDVQFGEILSVFDLVHQFRDQWKEIGILYGPFVQISIILARL